MPTLGSSALSSNRLALLHDIHTGIWREPLCPAPSCIFIFPLSCYSTTLYLGSLSFTILVKFFLQFSSVAQSCPTLCDPMNCSMPGFPVHHQLPESTQTHVHCVGDAIQPSPPLSSPYPPAFNLSQHQGFFQWVSSSHQVAKILEFQLQH